MGVTVLSPIATYIRLKCLSDRTCQYTYPQSTGILSNCLAQLALIFTVRHLHSREVCMPESIRGRPVHFTSFKVRSKRVENMTWDCLTAIIGGKGKLVTQLFVCCHISDCPEIMVARIFLETKFATHQLYAHLVTYDISLWGTCDLLST